LLYLLKILISALVITGASELARRSTGLAALLLALPIVSLLTFTWVWLEQRDPQQIARLSIETFWYVLPTLPLFIVLGMMLKHGFGFVASLAAGCAAGAALLGVTQWLMSK
jgi:hypothetical protein